MLLLDDDNHTFAAVQRLLVLRQHPGFAEADLSELATMAENLVEATFQAGEVVAAPGGRVSALSLIVEGQLASPTESWGPRQVFGVLEVIANRCVAAPVIATVETRSLQLAAADLSEVLEDNFGLLANALRGVSSYLLAIRERQPHAHVWPRPTTAVVPSVDAGLVERLIVLRQHFPFARIQALAALAHACVEIEVKAGELLCRKDEPALGTHVLLEGAVRSYRARDLTLVPNDAIGVLEMISGEHSRATCEALTTTRTLFIPAAALLDVMEDHTDLALGMLTMLAGQLLDEQARDGEAN